MVKAITSGLLAIILIAFFSGIDPKSNQKGVQMEIKLTSPAFEQGGMIPAKFTCTGANVSPALIWSGVPEQVKSLAIICDDPDAPNGNWVHWVIYNIPTYFADLPENLPIMKQLDKGITQGTNDFGKPGYGGPCPPSGIHRYFFRIYALDIETKFEPGLKKADLIKLMTGHIIAQGELMGRYKK